MGAWTSNSERKQVTRAPKLHTQGISHTGAVPQRGTRGQRPQGRPSLPWHFPQRKPHHHTPAPPATSPLPPLVSMTTGDDSLGKQKTVFLFAKVTENETPLPVLSPGIFQASKASHHTTQSDLSTPTTETWCHFTPRKILPLSFPRANTATLMSPFQGNRTLDTSTNTPAFSSSATVFWLSSCTRYPLNPPCDSWGSR